MSVPKALQYATSSFPISRNTFKLQPYSTAIANAGDQIQLSLPANSIVDLNTLSLYGTINTSTTGTNSGARLPANIESLLDSVYWTANGTQISNSFPMYGVLANAFLDWQAGSKNNLRKVLQNSGIPVATPAVNTQVVNQLACWNNWLGLPSSGTTQMIDTSAIGDLRLHIRLAPNTVLSTINATAAAYQVSTIYATIDCISVDDGGVYQSLLQKRMESGPLEIAFSDWYTFNMGNVTGSFSGRFSCATGSLDAVHATVLPANYVNCSSNAVAGYDNNTTNSGYFTRGFVSSTQLSDFQNQIITINNVNYPASGPLTLAETFNQTAIALGEHNNLLGGTNPLMNSLNNYGDYYYWQTTRLNSPGDASEKNVRTGQDTRGNAAFGVWQVSVLSGTFVPVLWCQTTKVWSIGAGRQMQITA